jgi:hypothetical protein
MNGIFVLGVKSREGWVFQQRSTLDTVISKPAFQNVNRAESPKAAAIFPMEGGYPFF